jgi:hypothetical protein
MKKCPFCAEMIQDDAAKCHFCREFVDNTFEGFQAPSSPHMPPEKMAEIRRLQRIASGRPTSAEKGRKTKGLLYLAIIVLILMYSWLWRNSQRANGGTPTIKTEISLQAFATVFGANSPLSPLAKDQEFGNFKGKIVHWSGSIVYINRGEGAKPFVTVRQNGAAGPSNVTVFLKKSERSSMDTLQVGKVISFSGRISEYGQQSEFITVIGGSIKGLD